MQASRWKGRAFGLSLLIVIAVVVAVGALAACSKKREHRAADLSALLPKDAASQISADLLTLAAELPTSVDGFGYVDFGMSLDDMTQPGWWTHYQAMYRDLGEMTKRRWGFDAKAARGVGVILFRNTFLVAVIAPTTTPSSTPPSGLVAGSLGRVTVLGSPSTVTAFLATAKQERLAESDPRWLRGALAQAVKRPVFFTAKAERLISAFAPKNGFAELYDVRHITAAAGAEGLSVLLESKLGRGDIVNTLVGSLLGTLTARLQVPEQLAAEDPVANLWAIVLRHYGPAALKSFEKAQSGDELRLSLRWHAPKVPASQPAPLVERVASAGETILIQVNLGAPVLRLLIAATDVLATPVDAEALHRELSDELVALGLPAGFDPRAFTISVGDAGYFLSFHNAALGAPGTSFEVPDLGLSAVHTRWGLAVTDVETRPALLAAVKKLASASASPPAIGAQLLGDDLAMLRVALDATQIPGELQDWAKASLLRDVAISLNDAKLVAEVNAEPGQGKAFAEELPTILREVQAEEGDEGLDAAYRQRARVPAEHELMVIARYHQREMLVSLMAPQKVEGDLVRLESPMGPYEARALLMALFAGVVAGIAQPLLSDDPTNGDALNDALEEEALNEVLKTQRDAATRN